MADYLSYAERPVVYTIMTRRLRDVARVSENITEQEEWKTILDLLQDLEIDICKLTSE